MLREVRFIKSSSNTNIPMPGYYISDDAEVYTINNPRNKDKLTRMTPYCDSLGKPCIEMQTTDSKRKIIRLEKLVATAFVFNPNNYTHVLHLNGNLKDCRAENLMWSKCCKCIHNHKFANLENAEQICKTCDIHNKTNEIKEYSLLRAIKEVGLWKLNGAYRKIAIMFITGNSAKTMAKSLHMTEQGLYKHIRNMRCLPNALPERKTSTITQIELDDCQIRLVNEISNLLISLIGKSSAQKLTIERSVLSLLVKLEIIAEAGTMDQQYELDRFAQDCWSALNYCNSSCKYVRTAYNS